MTPSTFPQAQLYIVQKYCMWTCPFLTRTDHLLWKRHEWATTSHFRAQMKRKEWAGISVFVHDQQQVLVHGS